MSECFLFLFCLFLSHINFCSSLKLTVPSKEPRPNFTSEYEAIGLKDSDSSPIIRSACVFNHVDSFFQMHTTELLENEGYEWETHYVTTADGYIFEVHRIPAPGKPAVYVMPGIFMSSRDLVINCQGRALGFKLHNAGYDVWLGNFRGSTFGRNHTTLSPKQREFWTFKIDDLINLDAPAAVDYILNHTGQKKLNWVGFSLGSNMLIGMLSSLPEYNEKINFGVTIGTAVYFANVRSAVLKMFARRKALIETFVTKYFHGEILPPTLNLLLHLYGPKACLPETAFDKPMLCSTILGLVDGRDSQQTGYVSVSTLLSGLPSPASAYVVGQWFQWILTGQYTKYDYGYLENLRRYGDTRPPRYDLSNVKAPILVFWAENDWICSKKDILKAASELPNLVGTIRVNWKYWNHVDFLYGKDADLLVYDYILNVMDQYNQ